METLKLEVGKIYRSRVGEEVKIVRYDGHPEFPYLGSNDKWYAKNGSFWYSKHLKDLIEEVTMPNVNQNITTKMQTLKLQVGKTYRSRVGKEVRIIKEDGGSYRYKGSDGEWYTESGSCEAFGKAHPDDLIEEVEEAPEPTRHTFAIPDGVKEITLDYFGNRIVVEMVPTSGPKPGDVMINDSGSVYIFKKVYDYGWHNNFVWVDSNGRAFYSNTTTCSPGRPATPEEAQLLFDVLKKEGKRWNPETMQVEKITEIDHICEWVNKHLNCRYYSHEGLTKVIYDYLKYKERKK